MTSATPYSDVLLSCERFQERTAYSTERFSDAKEVVGRRLDECGDAKTKYTCYCVGSIARGDAGSMSDLDLFILAKKKPPRLQEIKILSSLVHSNDELEYPEPSNDGEYLEIHSFKHMKRNLGKREDDSLNLFTARMLLLLESKALFNEELHETFMRKVLSLYSRDREGHEEEFLPLYLINDLLRYWRTLCLNYEVIRSENKPWRKKNINLKFSRLLTVYSAIVPAAFTHCQTPQDWALLLKQSPLERIATTLDDLADERFLAAFREIVDIYQDFLEWKDVPTSEIDAFLAQTGQREVQKSKAKEFSQFFYQLLTSDYVEAAVRRCLVI